MFDNTVSVEERKENIESRKKDDDDNVKSFWKRCIGQSNHYFQNFGNSLRKERKMTASDKEKTVKKLFRFFVPAKKLFRFFIPKVDNFGQEIPKERRDDFISVIQTECCKNENNGGYTKFEAKGGYMSDSGKIMEEDITVIETYGDNPLPPERMAHCSRYMAQESLIVMSVGNYEFKDYKGGADYTKYKLPKPEKSSADLLKATVRGIQDSICRKK